MSLKIAKIFHEHPLTVLRELGRGTVNAVFPNGANVTTTVSDVVLSMYLWRFYKHFNHTVNENHLVSKFFVDGQLAGSSITKCFSKLWEDLYFEKLLPERLDTFESHEYIFDTIQETIVDVHNELCFEIPSSLSGLDYFDIIELQNDPELLATIEHVKEDPSQLAISNCYDKLDELLRSEKYTHNPIAKGYISGSMSAGQIRQALGSRGFTSEMTNSIFKYPVFRSFTQGLNDMYSMVIESRSAAKALEKSTSAIQDTEYLTRRMRLITSALEFVVDTDCKSGRYTEWFVKPEGHASVGPDFKGDLPLMIGMWYLDPETNTEKLITSKDTHLINTTVKVRTILTCGLDNQHNVCKRCYGTKTHSMFKQFNLGKFVSTLLMVIVNQAQLSAKHLLTSTAGSDIFYPESILKYIKVKDNYLRFTIKSSKTIKQKLLIKEEDLFGLKNIISDLNKLEKLDTSRISSITAVKLLTERKGGVDISILPLAIKNRKPQFTKAFLHYVIKQGYTLRDDGYYEIELSEDYDTRLIMAVLPNLEYSFTDFGRRLDSFFKGTLSTPDDPIVDTEYAAFKLQTLICTKMDISISDACALAYAYSVVDGDNHSLPRHTQGKFKGENFLFERRSLGAMLGGDRIVQRMYHPNVMVPKNKLDSYYDVLLQPQKVLKFRTTYLD